MTISDSPILSICNFDSIYALVIYACMILATNHTGVIILIEQPAIQSVRCITEGKCDQAQLPASELSQNSKPQPQSSMTKSCYLNCRNI